MVGSSSLQCRAHVEPRPRQAARPRRAARPRPLTSHSAACPSSPAWAQVSFEFLVLLTSWLLCFHSSYQRLWGKKRTPVGDVSDCLHMRCSLFFKQEVGLLGPPGLTCFSPRADWLALKLTLGHQS